MYGLTLRSKSTLVNGSSRGRLLNWKKTVALTLKEFKMSSELEQRSPMHNQLVPFSPRSMNDVDPIVCTNAPGYAPATPHAGLRIQAQHLSGDRGATSFTALMKSLSAIGYATLKAWRPLTPAAPALSLCIEPSGDWSVARPKCSSDRPVHPVARALVSVRSACHSNGF